MHENKIVIIVRDDLKTWQKLNVTAFLSSAVAIEFSELHGRHLATASSADDALAKSCVTDDVLRVSGAAPVGLPRGTDGRNTDGGRVGRSVAPKGLLATHW